MADPQLNLYNYPLVERDAYLRMATLQIPCAESLISISRAILFGVTDIVGDTHRVTRCPVTVTLLGTRPSGSLPTAAVVLEPREALGDPVGVVRVNPCGYRLVSITEGPSCVIGLYDATSPKPVRLGTALAKETFTVMVDRLVTKPFCAEQQSPYLMELIKVAMEEQGFEAYLSSMQFVESKAKQPNEITLKFRSNEELFSLIISRQGVGTVDVEVKKLEES